MKRAARWEGLFRGVGILRTGMKEKTMRQRGVLAAILSLSTILSASGRAETAAPRPQWLATWAASAQLVGPFPGDFTTGFENQTIRQIVHVSVGGTAVRLHLTNAFGTQAVRFDAVYVGVQATGGGLMPGSNRRVTFGGQPYISIPPGGSALSDLAVLDVAPLENLAVSLFTAGLTGLPTMHLNSNQVNFVSEAGNFAADESDAAFPSGNAASWYFLDEVDVFAAASIKGAVLALGDSLTDGLGSNWDANNRYPDYLARRILAGPPGRWMGVLNGGLTGDRVLNDSPCFGVNTLARLDRDVLVRRGVKAVIFTQGSNDFGFPLVSPDGGGLPPECFQPGTNVSVDEVIAGYRQVIARVHAAGIRIFGGTLNPIKGGSLGSSETEVKRQALNAWIQESGEFDGVIDFAAAVADPRDPQALAPWYDSGDFMHPNDAGYQAMANAVNLALFR